MGRPPIGKAAMSSAERQQRFLDKLRGTGGAENEQLKAEIARLKAENAELRRQPATEITRDTLSKTAQEKYDAAERRLRKNIEREIVEKARLLSRELLESTALPAYNREREEWRDVIKRREGMMTKAQFNLIRACLHPDNSMTSEKRQRAWELFCDLEITFLNEQDRPTSSFPIVKTFEELMELKRQRSAARRSGGKSVSITG